MISKILRYSIALFLLLLTIAFLSFYLPPVQVFLSDQAEKAIANISSGKVVVEKLSFSSPISFSAKSIAVEDSGNLKAALKDVSAIINPLTFLSSKWEISSLHVSSLEIVTKSSEKISSFPGEVLQLPNISLEHFSLNSIQITHNDKVLFPSPLSIQGRFSNDHSHKLLYSELSIKIPQAAKGSASICLTSLLEKSAPSTTLILQDHGLLENWIDTIGGLCTRLQMQKSATEILSSLMNFQQPLSGQLFVEAKALNKNLSGIYKGKTFWELHPDLSFSLTKIDFLAPLGKITGALFVSNDRQWENNSSLFLDANAGFISKNFPIGVTAPTSTISLSGPVQNTKFTITSKAEEMTIGKLVFSQPNFKAQAELSQVFHFSLQGTSKSAGKLLTFSSNASWNYKDIVSITSTSVATESDTINLKGKWDLSAKLFTGDLEASAKKTPAALLNLFATPKQFIPTFTEPLNLQAHWYEEQGNQAVSFQLATHKILLEQLVLQDLLIKADLKDVFANLKGTAEITSGSLHYGPFEGASLSLRLRSDLANHWSYTFATSNYQDKALASGLLKFSQEEIFVSLKDFSMMQDGCSIDLVEESTFTCTKGKCILNPLRISIDKGTLWVASSLDEKAVNFVLQVDHFPLKFLPIEEIAGYGVDGFVSSKVMIVGNPKSPTGTISIDFSNLALKEELDHTFPPMNGKFFVKIHKSEMEAQGAFFAKNASPMKVQAKIPGKLSLYAPYFSLDRHSPFSLDFEASGEVSSLLELFLTDTTSLSGKGSINVAARGSLNTPRIRGAASLSDGIFENTSLGTFFQNIEASVIGEGRRLQLVELKATDGEKGLIRGFGEITLLPEKSFPFSINLDLDDVQLLKTDYVRSAFSGGLKVFGNKELMDVTGDLTVAQAEVHIPKQIPEVTEVVEIRYINQDPLIPAPTTHTQQAYFDNTVRLDIALSSPKNFVIRSQDLNSEWTGKVQILGDLAHPVGKGEVNLKQGTYLLNGSVYEINQGKMNFTGDFYEKTTLYATASRDIDNHLVEIIVKGRLMDPYLVLRSTPPLNKQQLLSLILFGQATGSFTPLQAEQIEQSLSNLTSDPDKINTLARIQKGLGIDNIQFMRSETGIGQETSIQVGKYLTRNVYLSINRALSDEVNRFALEANITKNLRGRIGATTDAEGEASIYWHYDY